MTISGSYTPDAYTGNASTTEFPVTYPFFGTSTDAEIEVIERTIATGAEATLVNGTDYTVAGGAGATGTVTAADCACVYCAVDYSPHDHGNPRNGLR